MVRYHRTRTDEGGYGTIEPGLPGVEAVHLEVEAVQLEVKAVQLEMESAHPPCAGDGTAGPGFTLGSHLPQVVLKKTR